MKKGDRVYINKNTKKSYVRLNGWSEEAQEIITLSKGTILYHTSVEEKLASFASVETCFNNNIHNLNDTGCVYKITLKNDIKAIKIDNFEVRIQNHDMTNTNLDIVYIGTITLDRTKMIGKVGYSGKYQAQHIFQKANFAKQYKQEESALQKKFKSEYIDCLKRNSRFGWVEYNQINEI